MRGRRYRAGALLRCALDVAVGLAPQAVDLGEFLDLLGAQVARQVGAVAGAVDGHVEHLVGLFNLNLAGREGRVDGLCLADIQGNLAGHAVVAREAAGLGEVPAVGAEGRTVDGGRAGHPGWRR